MKSGNRALSLSPSLPPFFSSVFSGITLVRASGFSLQNKTTSVPKEFSRIINTLRKNSSKFMWVYVVNFLSELDFFHGSI
jgi:hypothetical protein